MGDLRLRFTQLWQFDKTAESGKWQFAHYVDFKHGKVALVAYATAKDFDLREEIQGIYIGATVETVRKKFGEPSNLSASRDELMRVFSYAKYRICFFMEKNRVIGFGIYNPAKRPDGVKTRLKDGGNNKEDATSRTSKD